MRLLGQITLAAAFAVLMYAGSSAVSHRAEAIGFDEDASTNSPTIVGGVVLACVLALLGSMMIAGEMAPLRSSSTTKVNTDEALKTPGFRHFMHRGPIVGQLRRR